MPTPEQIINLVSDHEDKTESLRERMDTDYDLFRLNNYTGDDENDGFQKYTSNEPRTFASKVITLLSNATLMIRVPQDRKYRDEREISNDKERFLIGILKSADERLIKRLLQPVQEQLAWYTAIRGWYAGRALLVKEEDGSTCVDITPWDPRNVYWGLGKDGLKWACYRIKKTQDEIKDDYGVEVTPAAEEEDGTYVYDFYDEKENTVISDDGVRLKKATPHGSPSVPVFIGAVGGMPPLQSEDIGDTSEDYGESIYQADRELYETHNFNMSVMKEMANRSLKQGIKVRSPDGSKTLEENPHLAGSEVALGQGEDIEPLGLLEVAKEMGAFLALTQGEMQRGALPHSAYGEIPFSLSGFAINSLRQGVETVVQPCIKSIINAYSQICNLITDQYKTGYFAPMQLNGQDRSREWFNDEITPEVVGEGGLIVVEMLPSLPQDEPAKYQMAQFARQGEIPLLSDRFIREEVLGLQDADLIDDGVKEQLSERSTPLAATYNLMQSAERRGRDDMAAIYFGELQALMIQKQMELQQLQMAAMGMAQGPNMQPGGAMPGGAMPGGGPGQPPNGRQPGFPPQTLPRPAQGVPAPTPVPQAGPLVPQGMPRPGAQLTEEERLSRIGLSGPGG